MPSSSRPYKSKLLRFVLQQWQQGLNRQDRAWRQLQSTATWGAQAAIFPFYAIMRAVERASFVLGGSSQSPSEQPSPPTKAQARVTDLDHSLTAILTHTQQLLSGPITSNPGTKLTIAPKGRLMGRVKSLLHRITQPVGRWGELTHGRNNPPTAGGITARSSGINRKVTADLLRNGTTLASVIESRTLVVVNPKNEIFDILPPGQQTELRYYIARVMQAYHQSRAIVPRQTQRLSVKTVLTISAVFVSALPVEFKKAWSQIAPGPPSPSLPHITASGLQAEPRSRVFYPQTSAPGTVKGRTGRLPQHKGNNGKVSARRLTSNSPDAFEASVNDVNYLEHPLERILRLIDRVLTWCENRWQRWLRQS